MCNHQKLRFDDVKAGDFLVADDGFTCIADGAVLEVQQEPDGTLWVPCATGQHGLDGQEDEDGILVGLARASLSSAK